MRTLEMGIILAILLVVSIIDIKFQRIPLAMIVGLGILSLGVQLITRQVHIVPSLAGIGFGMFFCLVSKATREGFGYGDSLMIMVVGFHIGLMLMLQVLMVSFAILAIFSAILMTRKIKKKGDSIPFIPFLTMGYLIVTVQFL